MMTSVVMFMMISWRNFMVISLVFEDFHDNVHDNFYDDFYDICHHDIYVDFHDGDSYIPI